MTTAADTYSLGALAHVLLVGVPPHDLKDRSPPTILRDLRAEPVAPSRKLTAPPEAERSRIAAARGTSVAELHRSLSGDLDAILLRALAPKPERRYGSAKELAADLEAHLEDRSVTARTLIVLEQGDEARSVLDRALPVLVSIFGEADERVRDGRALRARARGTR